jgi:hypothetical protein
MALSYFKPAVTATLLSVRSPGVWCRASLRFCGQRLTSSAPMPPKKTGSSKKAKPSGGKVDLSTLTVAQLRERAREALGSGLSKLRTKADLIGALLGTKSAAPAKRAAASKSAKPARVPKAKAAPLASVSRKGSPGRSDLPKATVARRKMPEYYDEHLGELPDRYFDDSFVALPLDPEAVFFYWDFKPETEAAARAGLRSPRAVLTLYSGGHAVEHVDFTLESRAYYLRSLVPGSTYHAEIYFVGENGERRRLGSPSNAVLLPLRGMSPVIDDRFVNFPWGSALKQAQYAYAATPGGSAGGASNGVPLGSSPTARGKRATHPTQLD